MIYLDEENILITDSILHLEDKIIAIKSISVLDFSRKKEPPWILVYFSMVFFLIGLAISVSYNTHLETQVGELLFLSGIVGLVGSLVFWFISYLLIKNTIQLYLTSGKRLCIRKDSVNIDLEILLKAITKAMESENTKQI
jgi:hypothetical protein